MVLIVIASGPSVANHIAVGGMRQSNHAIAAAQLSLHRSSVRDRSKVLEPMLLLVLIGRFSVVSRCAASIDRRHIGPPRFRINSPLGNATHIEVRLDHNPQDPAYNAHDWYEKARRCYGAQRGKLYKCREN